MRRLLPILLLLGPWPAGAGALSGQGAAGQISVVRLNDLGFGTVIAGTSRTVGATDAWAAKFEVTGPKDALVTVSFSLPSALSDGGSTLAVAFGSTSAAWADRDRNNVITSFDPAQGAQVTVPKNKVFYVYLGGSVAPSSNQPAGYFTGVVTLSAAVN